MAANRFRQPAAAREFWKKILGPEGAGFRAVLRDDLVAQMERRSQLGAFVGPGNLIDTAGTEG